MRKTLIIALISIHLAGNTELGQLLKLPELVHHFFQHHQLDPQLSFFHFIVMHYAGDDGTKADDYFDKQLPCHNSHSNTTVVVYAPMIKDMPFHERVTPESHEYNSRIISLVSSKHVLLLLQPPKVA